MQLDWFTLVAQVINFLVLIWLLKQFLYGRIVKAMDEREAKIAARLDEAARERAEAEREVSQYRGKNQDLEDRREALLARAKEECEASRRRLVEEARRDVERMRGQWVESLRQEQRRLLEEFRERIGQQVFSAVRRALKDLANVELQEQIVNVFLDRVQRLESVERQRMTEAVHEKNRAAEFRSALPLSAQSRERVAHHLRDHLDGGLEVRFAVEPTLGCGVELYVDSHRLVWNLESYLETLEGDFFKGLEDRARNHEHSQGEKPASNGARPAQDRAG